MAKLLSVSINVSKIDKERLIEGKKGKYLNITIAVNDEKDPYDNDVSVWEGQSEEERTAKLDRNFLGNGRVVWSGEGRSKPNRHAAKIDSIPDEFDADDDIPF